MTTISRHRHCDATQVRVVFCLVALAGLGFAGCGTRANVEAEAPQHGTATKTTAGPKSSTAATSVKRNPVEPPAKNTPVLSVGTSIQKPKDITFADLKFDIEKGGDFQRSMLTPKIEALNGRAIRIRGYMLPSFHQKGLRQFFLLQNANCKFGGPEAYVYHNIQVKLNDRKTVSYSVQPITVEGVLQIKPFKDLDGKVLCIYYIGAKSVE